MIPVFLCPRRVFKGDGPASKTGEPRSRGSPFRLLSPGIYFWNDCMNPCVALDR